jgi:biotin transport system substrate-specific component
MSHLARQTLCPPRLASLLGTDAVARSLCVLAGIAALTAGARCQLPVGPVPITAQTLVVVLLGAMMGGRLAATAVASYVLIGLTGAPVFAAGGGPGYVLSPTFGYLLGFVPAAWLTGRLVAGLGATPGRLAAAMLAGHAVIFATGLIWLSLYVPADRLLTVGLVPFLPGLAIKSVLGGLIATAARRR